MRRRSMHSLGLFGLLVVVVSAWPLASGATSSHSQSAPHSLTPAPTCPAEDDCVTIPGTSQVSGGTVDVGPTQNLGDDQWVYVNTYGFTPGSVLHINYCTNTATLPTQPLCLSAGNPLIANTQYVVDTLSDGTESLSYQVLEVDSTDVPFTGQDPENADVTGTFFCDATAACSVDVTNLGVNAQGSTGFTSGNTAVIPITFATAGNGCGAKAASVSTESEYGMEFVLPVAAAASCSLSDPSIAFNTAADGLGAVSAVAAGAAEVAFTDDPEATAQQQVLQQGNFKLIPVALTANVVGFKAESLQGGALYPLNSLNLTPDMVAGLLTGIYVGPYNADLTPCPTSGCAVPPCLASKKKKQSCSLFTQANNQPGFNPPQQYEAFVRSDDAGSTGLMFSWLCNAPLTPVPLSIQEATSTFTATETEPETASTVLDVALGKSGQPLTKCPITDQYPPEALGASVTYTSYNDPDEESIKMNAYVQPGEQGSNAFAAFSTMNWAEARYYGLQIASLQNADGQFVAPTATSLDAAVADSTTNPDGTLTPNYASKDPDAYPMASVVYAAVCADPMPTGQATATADMLSQLLAVTGPTSTATLPDGFVPLPSSLAKQATAEIASDVIGGGSADATGCPPAPTASTTKTTTTTTKTTTVAPVVTPVNNAQGKSVPGPVSPAPQGGGKVEFPGLGSKLSTTNGAGQKKSGSELHLGFLTLSSSSSRVVLPAVVILGLLALLFGAFMAYSASLRELAISKARSWNGRMRRRRSGSSGGVVSWVARSGTRRKW